MKKYYLKPSMKFHQLNTSRCLLEGSGKFNSNETYRMNTISWGSSAAKSVDADFDEE